MLTTSTPVTCLIYPLQRSLQSDLPTPAVTTPVTSLIYPLHRRRPSAVYCVHHIVQHPYILCLQQSAYPSPTFTSFASILGMSRGSHPVSMMPASPLLTDRDWWAHGETRRSRLC